MNIKRTITTMAIMASTIAFGGLYIVAGGDFRTTSLTYWYYAYSTEHATNILNIFAQNGCTKHISVEIDDGTILTDVLSQSGHRDYTNMTYQFKTEGLHKIRVYTYGQKPTLAWVSDSLPNITKVISGSDLEYAISVDNGGTAKGGGVEEYIIKNGVKRIGAGCFRNAENLEYIYVPDSVVSIGDDAFNMNGAQATTKLKTVRLSRNPQFTSLSNNLFFRTMKLESLTIPSNVTSYGKWVLHSNYQLKTLTLGQPTSVLADSFCQVDDGVVKSPSRSGIKTINFYGTLAEWKSGPLPEHFGNTDESGDLDTVTITGGKAVSGSVTLNLNYPEPED